MRFGCETRLPWSPPRTKTSNTTTTPKSHENPNSSSVKEEATYEGSLGGGFLVKNLGLVLFYATHSRQPQCWVNLQTLPLQVLEATDIGNRRIAAATHSHTHIAREVFTAKVCRPRRFERQMALRFAVDVSTICGSAGKHATLAAAASNIVGEEACFFLWKRL